MAIITTAHAPIIFLAPRGWVAGLSSSSGRLVWPPLGRFSSWVEALVLW
jgi:hypothetical protein